MNHHLYLVIETVDRCRAERSHHHGSGNDCHESRNVDVGCEIVV
jgi:hypothetical protein